MVHLVIVKDPLDISRTMGYRVDGVFGSDIQPPWLDEFDIATLY
jgi:hypothetical protein